jgi:hypothetical protein
MVARVAAPAPRIATNRPRKAMHLSALSEIDDDFDIVGIGVATHGNLLVTLHIVIWIMTLPPKLA